MIKEDLIKEKLLLEELKLEEPISIDLFGFLFNNENKKKDLQWILEEYKGKIFKGNKEDYYFKFFHKRKPKNIERKERGRKYINYYNKKQIKDKIGIFSTKKIFFYREY